MSGYKNVIDLVMLYANSNASGHIGVLYETLMVGDVCKFKYGRSWSICWIQEDNDFDYDKLIKRDNIHMQNE